MSSFQEVPNQSQPETSGRPRKRRVWPWLAGALATVAAVVGIAVAARSLGGQDDQAAGSAASPTTATTEATTWKPSPTTTAPPPLPSPDDFVIGVNVLEKKCFGSAGCLVTYQIKPIYVGKREIRSTEEFTVVYEVSGGEEPQVSRFTVSGGSMSYEREESIRTPSSKSELAAAVTQVI
jgi:hypothetical protein